MWIEYGFSKLKRWYKSQNILFSIFLGLFLSILTSFVMIVYNLLFVETIVKAGVVFIAINIIVTVLIGPIIEELVYRGVIIDILEKWFRSLLCIVASSILFSLGHIPNNIIDFGIVYKVDGTLIPSTIAHSLSNVVVFIFIR